nr:MAG TPA: hypothetical protein [Caudoviricetes sp.]
MRGETWASRGVGCRLIEMPRRSPLPHPAVGSLFSGVSAVALVG